MNEDPLKRLFDELDYQILAPAVTTMAPCECRRRCSRGGRTCRICLKEKLARMVGHENAVRYVDELQMLKFAIMKKENAERKPIEKAGPINPKPFNYEWPEDVKKRAFDEMVKTILENDPYGNLPK